MWNLAQNTNRRADKNVETSQAPTRDTIANRAMIDRRTSAAQTSFAASVAPAFVRELVHIAGIAVAAAEIGPHIAADKRPAAAVALESELDSGWATTGLAVTLLVVG